MSGERASACRIAELRDELSGRELAIVRQVAELKLMSSRQIEAIHFDVSEHRSVSAAGRACRRALERLTNERLLVRLDRRIGGIRAGSAAFVYAIGPVGERVLGLSGPRHRFREPSIGFLRHTLAVAEIVVTVTSAARTGRVELLGLEAEPRCWRPTALTGGGTSMLRPDLFVKLGVEELEYRWFVEVDLGTEHLPTLLRKCQAYEAYYRSGREQAEHGVFPRVLWIMHKSDRVERLCDAIEADGRLTDRLFVVTTGDTAITTLAGGES